MLVIDMLISAATASAEIWALRRDAIRGTLLNFEQLCFGELFLFPDNFRRNKLVLYRVRNKNGFALFPRDAFSAEGDVFDFQINNAHTMQIRSINIQAPSYQRTPCSEGPSFVTPWMLELGISTSNPQPPARWHFRACPT